LDKNYFELAEFILQQDPAVSAKVIRLAVNILYATAVMHDAGPFRAVAQRESMAQFVNGFFAETAVHRRIGSCGIEALLKAIGGYDPAP
jgi:hypothetical protein